MARSGPSAGIFEEDRISSFCFRRHKQDHGTRQHDQRMLRTKRLCTCRYSHSRVHLLFMRGQMFTHGQNFQLPPLPSQGAALRSRIHGSAPGLCPSMHLPVRLKRDGADPVTSSRSPHLESSRRFLQQVRETQYHHSVQGFEIETERPAHSKYVRNKIIIVSCATTRDWDSSGLPTANT